MNMAESGAELSGLRKAAILLVMLGEDAATSVYRRLSQPQLQLLTREIADLKTVAPETAAQVLEEYHRLSLNQDLVAEGGEEYARAVLQKAFGGEGSKTLLDQISHSQELSSSQLDALHRADPQELARLLEGEQPQTVALVLAYLDAKQASALLVSLPPAVRVEAVKRLAQLQNFPLEMAQRVSVVLHRKLQGMGEQNRRSYAGYKSAADLMNRLDPVTMKALLDTIESDDAKMALKIRNLMFTFDDLLGVADTGIRELVGRLDKKVLALALKGSSEEVRNHLVKAISARAYEMLKEDMDAMGPVRAKEVSKAQQEAVGVARQLEAEGKIVLRPETGDEFLV